MEMQENESIRWSSNMAKVNQTFESANYDLGALWGQCKTRRLPFTELIQEVADVSERGHSLHSPF